MVERERSLPARACLSLHVEFPALRGLTVEVAEVRWSPDASALASYW